MSALDDLLTVGGAEGALRRAVALRNSVLEAMAQCSDAEYRQLREMQADLDALITRLTGWVETWKTGRPLPPLGN